MVAKLSSETDHATGVLGHLGAGAHGDADVGGLDGRRVVHAVAGHGHDVALLAQRLDEQDLVLWCDPAHDPDVVDLPQALLFAQARELLAQDGPPGDAQLRGDGRAGDDVVAGHHAYPDVGLGGGLHGRLGGLPRRVDHADQAGQLEAGDPAEQVALRIEGRRVEVAVGAGHDPQALTLHALDVAFHRGLEVLVERHRRVARDGRRRPGP